MIWNLFIVTHVTCVPRRKNPPKHRQCSAKPRNIGQKMTQIPNVIDPELLEILRCPITRGRLRQEGDFLIGEVGGLQYPVREGIPVMLPEEAKLPAGVASLDEFRDRFATK